MSSQLLLIPTGVHLLGQLSNPDEGANGPDGGLVATVRRCLVACRPLEARLTYNQMVVLPALSDTEIDRLFR